MTRRIQTLITAWALLLAAVVSLFVLPSFSYAEEGQWVYDSSAQTLTSETQGVTLNNVQVNGNGQLTIGNNGSASFASLDLTGSIIDASDPEATYSVVAISSAAFFESQLETVVLPDSITEIGDYAFEDSESLQSVTLPKGLTSIPIFMFEGCSSLASIAIPDSVTYIGNSAFAYCTSLTSVELPENLTSIDSDAFSNCTSLASIDIPRNVSSIADHVFENCKALESITLPDGLTTIESFTFNNCTSLESVQFPSTLITISGSAFSNCGSLEVVDIPSGVTTIGADAFRNCTALSSITLPENVTNIGAQAFGGCSSMIGITVLSTTPPALSETAFSDCNAIRMICVPASVLSEYKTADGWTSFADKLEGVYKLTVVNGVDSGWYPTGQTIPLVARVPEGQHFTGWIVDPADSASIIDSSSIIAGIIMPESDVTVTATFAPHTFVDGVCSGCEELEPDYVPVITEGADAVWQRGSSSGLTFTANTAISAFDRVEVDGGVLDSSNYTVTEGSTVVTLTSEYLKTLEPGLHTLSIESDLGSAQTTFTIQEDSPAGPMEDGDSTSTDDQTTAQDQTGSDNTTDKAAESTGEANALPQTGDSTVWWPFAGLAAIATVVGALAYRMKKKYY